MSKQYKGFRRAPAAELARRLAEPRRFIQVVAGPRQVGKTTLVQQVSETLKAPVRFVSADEPTLRGPDWIAQQWEAARLDASSQAVLVVDEVQKAVGWAESVQRLWDEDTRARRRLKVVLLGSAPLLVQQGLGESLAGRFEMLHLPHWSFAEMREAFGFTSLGSTSRRCCAACSSSAAGTRARCSRIRRCWASFTTPATPRRWRTTCTCLPAPAC